MPLRAKVAFLEQPDAYPDGTRRVETVETHMAWVFLTDDFAYKLKKPVRYEFLDFSTLEARRRDCEDEVRLNRRLAPDVYLGTVALCAEPSGGLRLGDGSGVVDWLVKMRRLGEDTMLDVAISRRAADEATILPAARLLAGFYRRERAVETTAQAYEAGLERDIRANLEALESVDASRQRRLAARVAAAQRRFIAGHAPMLAERVASGRVVEAHGDLRPEHVYLGPEPAIIDCLEFEREFRILDAVDELGFLSMECERLGSGYAGRVFLRVYQETTGDMPPASLRHLYKSIRAGVRARIATWHADEPGEKGLAHWRTLAGDYLRVASVYAALLE